MATEKATTKATKKSSGSRSTAPKSMPEKGENPKGGLTAAGREYFKKKEGSDLKPGVTGAADTPEKMRRKGSFLRRHFANPRGPMKDEHGKPTRLALSAHAWGEPVPKDMAAAKKLAAKGHALLEKYAATKKAASKKPAAKKSTAKKAASKKSSAKKSSPKSTSRKSTVRNTSR